MNGQRVAILESRLGAQLAELIVKRGGKPVWAPALAEIPDLDPRFISDLIQEWQAVPVKAAIFQTGVGTHALFQSVESLGLTATLLRLLAATTIVVRGPKPTGALRSHGVHIDLSAKDPFTTREVLVELNALALKGERVLVQRYGARNAELERGLNDAGAIVMEIPVYRWSLPSDVAPMAELVAALERREIDAVVVTSASQIHNLFELAGTLGKAGSLAAYLNETLVASIGPVCSAALLRVGVKPALEASPPKLGPLLHALDDVLASR